MHLPVEARASFATDLGDVRQIGARPPLARTFLDLVEEKRERLVEELHRLQERVGEPDLESLLRAQHAVLAQRVLDDELHGLLGADELRHELCPAPAGDEAEEDLRTCEVADRRGDGAVVAVQRDLDAASDRGAVDRGDGDERELADPAEELVPRFAAEPRALGRDLPELADVRADSEHERLAGEQQPAPVARAQLVEYPFE